MDGAPYTHDYHIIFKIDLIMIIVPVFILLPL